MRRRILTWLGIVGSASCYVAMFPLSLVGILGLLSISSSAVIPALNAYMVSPLFQPILLFSIVLLIVGMVPFGKTATALSIAAGVLIFVSMNVSMRPWIFLFSFFVLAVARIVGMYQRERAFSFQALLVSALPFILIALILGLSTYI